MSYCQECGSHFEQDIGICSSCGNKLSDVEETDASLSTTDTEVDPLEAGSGSINPLNPLEAGEEESVASSPEANLKEPEQLEITTEFDENPVFEEKPVEFMHQEGLSIGSHRNQVESHLGKGLIKPVAVENCMDGFHFKYDEPQRQITKPEPQKEKIVEFRVSGDLESSSEAKEVKEAQEYKEEEKVLEDTPDIVGAHFENGEKRVEPEAIVEVESESGLKSEPESEPEDANSDEATLVEKVDLPEDELISEIDNLEPEISSDIEAEVIWQGHRTWNGLTLKEEYRITDRSAILVSGDGLNLKEIEWSLVSKISLKQNWLTKLLGIGNLEIIGLNSEPLLILEGIDHPEQVEKTLVQILDQFKKNP